MYKLISDSDMNGYDIVISWGGSPIAYMKTHEVQTECDKQEVSSPTDGEWRKYIKGRKGWSVSVRYLVKLASNLSDLLSVGNTYTLTISDRNGGNAVSGSAILVTCKQSYAKGNLCEGAFEFLGTGPLATPSS